MCQNKTIVDIQCRSMTGNAYNEMGENTKCEIPMGVYCRNNALEDASCGDYEMRMLCSDGPSKVIVAIFIKSLNICYL